MNTKYILLLFILGLVSCHKNEEKIESKQLSTTDNEIINYVEYCNERYDMCFDYPSNFGPKPDPINGDGRIFINRADSSKIIMYGFIDETGDELNAQLDILKEILDHETVEKLDNGYEITGVLKDNGHLYHEMLLVKTDEENLQVVSGLQFSYPQNKTKKFDGYWETMTEKFR